MAWTDAARVAAAMARKIHSNPFGRTPRSTMHALVAGVISRTGNALPRFKERHARQVKTAYHMNAKGR